MPFRLKRSEADIRQALADRDIPDAITDYLMDEPEAPQAYEMLTWFVVMFWFAGIFIGVQYLWPILVDFSKSAALFHAKTTNAILFDYSFGPALMLGALAWVFICLSILGIILAVKPNLKKSVFTGLVTDKVNGFIVRHFLKKARSDKSLDITKPENFVSSFFNHMTSFMEWQAILLSVFTAGIMYLEFQSHTIVSKQSVEKQHIIPFISPEIQLLSEAKYVELGCNYTDENMSHLNYTIHFLDGTKIDLGATFPVEGQWIDQAEIIDKILVQNDVEFRRWTWPGRTSLHPECINKYATKFEPDGNVRVNNLLRTNQF